MIFIVSQQPAILIIKLDIMILLMHIKIVKDVYLVLIRDAAMVLLLETESNG
jgi:hypothetical protein